MNSARFFRVCIFVSLCLIYISQSKGELLVVDSNGFGNYVDVQSAIDDSADGDVIEIRAGTYKGQGNYNIDPNGRSITIRSAAPEDIKVVAATVIDANFIGRGFYFHSGEDSNCVLMGLTIRNGIMSGGYGGCIYCASSNPRIVNCVIRDSQAIHGGGIYLYDTASEIIGCQIINNESSGDGGGIECWWSEPVLENCIIGGNRAGGKGGGIDLYFGGNADIGSCTIAGNRGGDGGGVFTDSSEVTVKNSVIWGNVGGQVSTLAATVDANYCDVEGGYAGNGNISADPCFVFFDVNSMVDQWDLHLKSIYGRYDANSEGWVFDTVTSSCIDGGDINSDWSGEMWPNGKRINLGVYGGTPEASKKGLIYDFDISGEVDYLDLSEMVSIWLCSDHSYIDVTKDGFIDFADFSLLGSNWLCGGN